MSATFLTTTMAIGIALFVLGLALSMWSVPTAFMVTGALISLVSAGAKWYSGIESELPVSSDRR